jgi:hypothetical protein
MKVCIFFFSLGNTIYLQTRYQRDNNIRHTVEG